MTGNVTGVSQFLETVGVQGAQGGSGTVAGGTGHGDFASVLHQTSSDAGTPIEGPSEKTEGAEAGAAKPAAPSQKAGGQKAGPETVKRKLSDTGQQIVAKAAKVQEGPLRGTAEKLLAVMTPAAGIASTAPKTVVIRPASASTVGSKTTGSAVAAKEAPLPVVPLTLEPPAPVQAAATSATSAKDDKTPLTVAAPVLQTRELPVLANAEDTGGASGTKKIESPTRKPYAKVEESASDVKTAQTVTDQATQNLGQIVSVPAVPHAAVVAPATGEQAKIVLPVGANGPASIVPARVAAPVAWQGTPASEAGKAFSLQAEAASNSGVSGPAMALPQRIPVTASALLVEGGDRDVQGASGAAKAEVAPIMQPAKIVEAGPTVANVAASPAQPRLLDQIAAGAAVKAQVATSHSLEVSNRKDAADDVSAAPGPVARTVVSTAVPAQSSPLKVTSSSFETTSAATAPVQPAVAPRQVQTEAAQPQLQPQHASGLPLRTEAPEGQRPAPVKPAAPGAQATAPVVGPTAQVPALAQITTQPGVAAVSQAPAQPAAVAAQVAPLAATHASSPLLATPKLNEHAAVVNAAGGAEEATLPHTTLSATPTSLEVGVSGGTHGWLKIRAELSAAGEVNASLSGTSAAANSKLQGDLPALSSFLANEKLPMGALNVTSALHGVGVAVSSQAAPAISNSTFLRSGTETGNGAAMAADTSAGGGRAQGQAHGQAQGQPHGDAQMVPVVESTAGARQADGDILLGQPVDRGRYGIQTELDGSGLVSSVGYGAGGGWLNVRV